MSEKLCRWIADRLPRRIVHFCGIRLLVHATSGKWYLEDVRLMTIGAALKRWEEEK